MLSKASSSLPRDEPRSSSPAAYISLFHSYFRDHGKPATVIPWKRQINTQIRL
ncbi:hypothetical protein BDV39DRAFT_165093 [Aspergillus sergii]|uniref:Uncharacterized protein n=1 Tax=Aspergillus sergii TaxID=1034303 RepID=A0A5N6XKB8_9EURO|nr:hypothetical protein BDV39DRAFT_165093 [Aspergillus sergii]